MYKDSVQGFVFAIRRHAYALYHVEIRLLHVGIALYLRCKKVFVHKLVYAARAVSNSDRHRDIDTDTDRIRRRLEARRGRAVVSLGKLLPRYSVILLRRN